MINSMMKEKILIYLRIAFIMLIVFISIFTPNQFAAGMFLKSFGFFLILVGLFLWVMGEVALGGKFNPFFEPRNLITTGIYSKTRHPIYIGLFFLCLGLNLLTGSVGGLIMTLFVLLPILLFTRVSEEVKLMKRFGERYLRYKRETLF